jgi:hypothetical protein
MRSGRWRSRRKDSRFRGNDGVGVARPRSNHGVIPAKAGIHPGPSKPAGTFLRRTYLPTSKNPVQADAC